MGRSEERLARAELHADRARNRLVADLLALKNRLMPARLFGDLFRKAKASSADAAEAGVDAVKARPGLTIGIAALAGLFLARKPIARAISSRKPETPAPRARSSVKRSRKAKP